MMGAAYEIAKILLPFVGAILIVVGIALMIIFAPDDARQALNSEYSSAVKGVAAILGPTGAAVIGDLAQSGERPTFTPGTPARVRRAYYVSRIASCVLFGIIGGATAQWAAIPSLVGWGIAGVGGFLGTKIVNIVFNRVLDKYAPPVSPPGGQP
jgi:hypothetical protein